MTLCYSHRREDPFVRLDKGIVFDSNISWKAKGILCYAFSRPTSWSFYFDEMVKYSRDGADSLRSGLKELEEAGYLHRTIKQKTDGSGQLSGWDYNFFEKPITPEEFKLFHRNGGFPDDGKIPIRGKPDPIKNDVLSEIEKKNNTPIVPLPSSEALGSGPPTEPSASVSKEGLKKSSTSKKQTTPMIDPTPEAIEMATAVNRLAEEANPVYKSVSPLHVAREIQELVNAPASASIFLEVVRFMLESRFYRPRLYRKGNIGHHIALNFVECNAARTAPKPKPLFTNGRKDRVKRDADGNRIPTPYDNLF